MYISVEYSTVHNDSLLVKINIERYVQKFHRYDNFFIYHSIRICILPTE